ncbi:hypothetical protein V2S66_17405 [Streptomyces sp. V4-01]|uniref:Uncharacterized protein n=1 Tax=Actinacidiphila polyblastidii TaxID=3110430 RepID=A0ABU7PD60_9ACTN|nr:hypothetical protein [Streptomyces sp. V4-01]
MRPSPTPPPATVAPVALHWPAHKPKGSGPPAPHRRALTVTMLLTTVPALLAVAVLRPGSSTARRNR